MEGSAKRSADSDGPPPKKLARNDPPFIRYLFTPPINHSCYFSVGDQSEMICIEKRILMAHSEPFQLMLQDSALAEKGIVRIPDIEPHTFKDLLRFVYGHDILSTLTMEESAELMYAAEKYMVEELKLKLSTHMSSILSVDNVFIPLQRPECYKQQILKQNIDKLIREDTCTLLKQKHFLDLNTFGLVTILQQDALAVPEIELWRGVLKWAKHKGNNDHNTPAQLRELMSEPLKHIRLCTLAIADFCKEVVPTKMFSDHEVVQIITSISNKHVLYDLTSVCNEIETRNLSFKLNSSQTSIFTFRCASNKFT